MLQNLVGNVSVPDYDLACTGGGTRGSIMGQPFMIISSGIGPMQVGKGRAGQGRAGRAGHADNGQIEVDCRLGEALSDFPLLPHSDAHVCSFAPPSQAATCVQLAMTICPQRIKETFYIGTSGWPAAIGGILNPDVTCNTTNPNRGRGQVTRVGERKMEYWYWGQLCCMCGHCFAHQRDIGGAHLPTLLFLAVPASLSSLAAAVNHLSP